MACECSIHVSGVGGEINRVRLVRDRCNELSGKVNVVVLRCASKQSGN